MNIDAKRRLRAIRILSSSFPARTAEERLAKIVSLADGTTDPEEVKNSVSPDLGERLEAGQASRSVRMNTENAKRQEVQQAREEEAKTTKKKKRSKKSEDTHDRQETGGFDRSADLNQ